MARITSIGEVQNDGSILLYDKNIDFRKDMTTPRRYVPSGVQKQKLSEWGLQWVTSSFISGIGKNETDLFIRFRNGSYYVYYGFVSHYDKILQASSKGRYFIRYIRSTKNYEKLGSLPFKDDLKLEDLDLFKEIENEMNKIVAMMYLKGKHEIIYDKKTQKEFLKIVYAGETVFLAINSA